MHLFISWPPTWHSVAFERTSGLRRGEGAPVSVSHWKSLGVSPGSSFPLEWRHSAPGLLGKGLFGAALPASPGRAAGACCALSFAVA